MGSGLGCFFRQAALNQYCEVWSLKFQWPCVTSERMMLTTQRQWRVMSAEWREQLESVSGLRAGRNPASSAPCLLVFLPPKQNETQAKSEEKANRNNPKIPNRHNQRQTNDIPKVNRSKNSASGSLRFRLVPGNRGAL